MGRGSCTKGRNGRNIREGGEETFYVGEGKQVREWASKERCLD